MFNSADVDEKELLKNLKSDFQIMQPIPRMNYFRKFFTCRSKYSKMLDKSNSILDKQLDLRKFIYSQRV